MNIFMGSKTWKNMNAFYSIPFLSGLFFSFAADARVTMRERFECFIPIMPHRQIFRENREVHREQ